MVIFIEFCVEIVLRWLSNIKNLIIRFHNILIVSLGLVNHGYIELINSLNLVYCVIFCHMRGSVDNQATNNIYILL